MKILLVGRHVPDFGEKADEFEVVGQEDITWPATSEECQDPLNRLHWLAGELGAERIVFQNTPGQLVALLVGMANYYSNSPEQYGVVISKPGPRPAGIIRDFHVSDEWDAGTLVDLAQFANPRVKTEKLGKSGIRVTVDPPMVFEFSHIEWF